MEITTTEQVLALPFVPYAERLRLPMGPGLYFAVIDRQSVGYIGISTISIRGRWHQHPMKFRLSGLGEITVAYVEISDYSILRRAERVAVREIDPPINFHYIKNPLARHRQLTAAEFLAGRPRKQSPRPSPD